MRMLLDIPRMFQAISHFCQLLIKNYYLKKYIYIFIFIFLIDTRKFLCNFYHFLIS